MLKVSDSTLEWQRKQYDGVKSENARPKKFLVESELAKPFLRKSWREVVSSPSGSPCPSGLKRFGASSLQYRWEQPS